MIPARDLEIGMQVETPNDGFCKILHLVTNEKEQVMQIHHFDKNERKRCFTRKLTKLVNILSEDGVDRLTAKQAFDKEAARVNEEESKRLECYRKKVFHSFKAADERAIYHSMNGVFMRAYQCTVCGEWHLTSRV
jgi:hypothetical protein